jgi:predicted O-methyltransferase YrrM
MLDSRTEALLAEYHARAKAEAKLAQDLTLEEGLRRRDEFLLSVGPSTGQLLSILAQESGAKTILELGTSYGYSTVWLADAARTTGGKLITLELAAEKSEYARSALAKADLDGYVDFKVGDALQILKTLSGPIDLVLVDLWKDLYIPCFDLFVPKLAAGALVIADNMVEPFMARKHAEAYRAHVRASGKFDSVLLPVGSGIEVSRLRATA